LNQSPTNHRFRAAATVDLMVVRHEVARRIWRGAGVVDQARLESV
jgi:hypothetical protein